jgi:ribonuclease P/MRP protein subunit RPP40
MLKRTFEHFDLDMVNILYKTFVRPHLEFAASVWNPYAANDISVLEKFQRRAT